jgi:molecular chaperone DnaK (HSP70)
VQEQEGYIYFWLSVNVLVLMTIITDLSTNTYALRRLRTAFERAQGTLSSATQTTVEIYTLTCARFVR